MTAREPGRQRGLDRRLDAQAAGDRVAGKQTGPDHHGRVGRVGARRDRRDGDRARADRVRPPVDLDVDRRVGAHAARGRGRVDRFCRRGDLFDGVGGDERRRVRRRERGGRGILDEAVAGDRHLASEVADVGLQPVREVRAEVLAQRLERDAVLRPARPGDGRRHARQVELEELVERRPVAGLAPQPLGLRVALDQLDPLG